MHLKNYLLLVLFLLAAGFGGSVHAQRIQYVIDSVPLPASISDLKQDLDPAYIDHFRMMKNKDSLKRYGYEDMDAAIFVFTKGYMSRPDSLRTIPGANRMIDSNGYYLLKGSRNPYTGRIIDFYANTNMRYKEGTLVDGRKTGLFITYFRNGRIEQETRFDNGVQQGLFKEYYADGTVSSMGVYMNGHEDGVWESYFPNGQVSHRVVFQDGDVKDTVSFYYSSGKVKKMARLENGKLVLDALNEKLTVLIKKAEDEEQQENHKAAKKNYDKCLQLDSGFVDAYYGRGNVSFNEGKYDAAIADYDKAIALEPYLGEALYKRAMARIEKGSGGRKLSSSSGVTVMAVKKKAVLSPADAEKVCSDLHMAKLLNWLWNALDEPIATYCTNQAGSTGR